jgi:hypothetical protein
MTRRKIAYWMTIREMCQNCYAQRTEEEVEVQATALARLHTGEEVGAFKRECAVAKLEMEVVVKEAVK